MLAAGVKQNFNDQAARREIKQICLYPSDQPPNMHIKFRYGRIASDCLRSVWIFLFIDFLV